MDGSQSINPSTPPDISETPATFSKAPGPCEHRLPTSPIRPNVLMLPAQPHPKNSYLSLPPLAAILTDSCCFSGYTGRLLQGLDQMLTSKPQETWSKCFLLGRPPVASAPTTASPGQGVSHLPLGHPCLSSRSLLQGV